MKRSVLLVAAVSLTLVLAGCTGSIPGTGGAAADTTTDGSDPGSGEDGGAGDGDVPGTVAGDGSWEPFRFDRPGTYTFDVFVEGEGEGSLVWDVEELSENEMTATVTYDVGDTRFEQTVTGDSDAVFGELLYTPAGALLLTTTMTPGSWYGDRDLSVGDGWSYQTSEGSGSFEVTGTDSVGGIACYTTEMIVDGTTLHEACIAPDHGIAPHSAYYNDDGTRSMEIRLVSYEAR